MIEPHLSAFVRSGNTYFLSGQLAFINGEISGDIEAQTIQTLENIATTLKAAHLSISDVVKVTIWLRDREDFAGFNAAYASFFGSHKPARSTVICALALPEARIEIEVTAIQEEA